MGPSLERSLAVKDEDARGGPVCGQQLSPVAVTDMTGTLPAQHSQPATADDRDVCSVTDDSSVRPLLGVGCVVELCRGGRRVSDVTPRRNRAGLLE
ncbi:hypothetical protein D8S78_10940 [Natrialba swarupiae]|nr:hypothetical protein [Natrialba swarupiae]